MKEKFTNFMRGRYGTDRLNRLIGVLSLICFFLGIIAEDAGKGTFFTLAIVLIGYSYFRMFSKNIAKRSEENNKYLKMKLRLFSKLKNVKERWVQRKDYKFFECPRCHATLRVPRGKGKIKIVCRKCGHTFLGKS